MLHQCSVSQRKSNNIRKTHQVLGGDEEAEGADEGADEEAQAEGEETPDAGVLWGGPRDEDAGEEEEEAIGDEDGQGAMGERDAYLSADFARQAEPEQPQRARSERG